MATPIDKPVPQTCHSLVNSGEGAASMLNEPSPIDLNPYMNSENEIVVDSVRLANSKYLPKGYLASITTINFKGRLVELRFYDHKSLDLDALHRFRSTELPTPPVHWWVMNDDQIRSMRLTNLSLLSSLLPPEKVIGFAIEHPSTKGQQRVALSNSDLPAQEELQFFEALSRFGLQLTIADFWQDVQGLHLLNPELLVIDPEIEGSNTILW